MNKKGFTLIELLAVIVILAVIALIATPIIMNTISSAKKGAWKDTAYGIIKAAELSAAKQVNEQDDAKYRIYFYNNSMLSTDDSNIKLEYKGQTPKYGIIIVNPLNQISMSIYDGANCASKSYIETAVTLTTTSKDTCIESQKNILKGFMQDEATKLFEALEAKKASQPTFDLTTLNETNINTVFNASLSNYKSLKVSMEGNVPSIVLVGKNDWDALLLYGTRTNNVVHDGLVVFLDASNPHSYSGTGNTWYDLSGNTNNATKNGSTYNPTWDSGGYWYFPATALGINGGMTIPNSTSLSSATEMTIEMVVTLETKTLLSGDNDWMCLISKSSTRSNQTPAISIHQLTGNRYFHVERPAAYNSAVNIFSDYSGTKWYHLVAAVGPTSSSYLNGTLVATATGGMVANNYVVNIGFDSGLEMFKGKMAYIRIYNRALSQSEVQNNFNSIKSKFGL